MPNKIEDARMFYALMPPLVVYAVGVLLIMSLYFVDRERARQLGITFWFCFRHSLIWPIELFMWVRNDRSR